MSEASLMSDVANRLALDDVTAIFPAHRILLYDETPLLDKLEPALVLYEGPGANLPWRLSEIPADPAAGTFAVHVDLHWPLPQALAVRQYVREGWGAEYQAARQLLITALYEVVALGVQRRATWTRSMRSPLRAVAGGFVLVSYTVHDTSYQED